MSIVLFSEPDPALDIESSDYITYLEDWDPSHLVAQDGKELIRYVCNEPDIEDRMEYMNGGGYPMLLRAFRRHTKRIENVGKRDGEPWTDSKSLKAGLVSKSWIKKSGLSDGEMISIGAAIVKRCVINRDELKNS